MTYSLQYMAKVMHQQGVKFSIWGKFASFLRCKRTAYDSLRGQLINILYIVDSFVDSNVIN